MSSTLEYRGVSKTYPNGERPAVSDVNLRVEKGELLALVGQSGSGKTTLLRLASGLEAPDSGQILVGDKPVAGPNVWRPAEERGIGFVFQDGALFPHMTVAQNIDYGLSALQRDRRESVVESMLAMVGMQGFGQRYPHELSGGERQRLAVVRALAPEPNVVLLDEPFSNLDQALRRSLRDEIRRILQDLGTTAILVSHDTDDALSIGDRVAILNEGKIEQVGTPKEIYHEPVNGYCARLFGPANYVATADREPRWVRPGDMRVVDLKRNGAIEIVVKNVWDAGRYLEAIVTPVSSANGTAEEEWIIYATNGIPEVGGRTWIEIDFP